MRNNINKTVMDLPLSKNGLTKLASDVKGRVAIPILLYFLGVPGIFALSLWFVFFRR